MNLEQFKEKYGIESYTDAQITLVIGKSSSSSHYDLLWGCVELLHPENPTPATETVLECKISSYRCYTHRFTVGSNQALEWFDKLLCRRTALLPDPKTGQYPDSEGPSIVTKEFLAEPNWPSLSVITEDTRWNVVPFDLESPLICSAWQEDSDAFGDVSEDNKCKLINWVKDKTGFDLGVDKQLLGSIHLLVHNPVFRKVDVRLKPNEANPDTALVLVDTVLRTGETYSNITLSVLDKRDTGWKLLYSGQVTESRTEATSGTEHPREVMIMLSRNSQLLYVSEPHTFVYMINMGFSVATGTRKVFVKQGLKEETYEVGLRTSAQSSMIGIEPPYDGLSLMRGIRVRILSKEKKAKFEQVYLHGNQEQATSILRDILSKGSRRFLFVDPYFNAVDFGRFAAAVPCIDSTIEILSSTEIVNGRDNQGKMEVYKDLLKASEDIQQEVCIRIMGDGTNSIHDRFLLCDENLWMLGSSLNSFGTKGTMLVKLPDPKPVISKLEKVWDGSKTLQERLDEVPVAATIPRRGRYYWRGILVLLRERLSKCVK